MGPKVPREDQVKREPLGTALVTIEVTSAGPTPHICELVFDDLVECFTVLTPEGWQTPEWLINWGLALGYLKEIVDE